MERYLCIHCHFYQPPRENPWLEAIELQDSAYPYHDWNERISAECYAPNAAARILDPEGRIVQIVNNYRQISFNFGPTLLSWLEDKVPETYASILAADRESLRRFNGHGSALAQAYNHIILPLANRRDKRTQVLWGIGDFRRRFGREPEGMWLPETAVDVETLEVLAGSGICFTILAPHQAKQVRQLRRRSTWKDVEGGRIDPTRPYVCRLPSGRSITIFFYDGPISRAVAFEGLLADGIQFADRLIGGFDDSRKWPQLMHIATDGETYGHHSSHGDMALAYALHHIESKQLARITNYGEYLALHRPNHEVEILEDTSWSCAHGVERWRSHCGCSGGRAGWTQQWRGPLRSALDWLRDAAAGPYEQKAVSLFRDPWAARDDYIQMMAQRSPETLNQFLEKHAAHKLEREETVTALKLLELQRHLMLMYTSCGWFFDEVSGIETVQVIFYAGRALQLAQELFGETLEPQFLECLALVQSNLPEQGNGARIYEKYVKPAVVNLLAVGAHYAVSSAFDGYGQHDALFCYDVERDDYRQEHSGRSSLSVGHARLRSQITLEETDLIFGVLHLGDHNVGAGVAEYGGPEAYAETRQALMSAFAGADMAQVLRILDQRFSGQGCSLKSLFRDEQRRILRQIMGGVLTEAEASYRGIYDAHASLMRFLSELRIPLPTVLKRTAEFVLNAALRREFEADHLDLERISALLDSARRDNVELDAPGLSYGLRKRLEQMMQALVESPGDLNLLRHMQAAARLARSFSFELDLWRVQNRYWQLLQTVYPGVCNSDGEDAHEWCALFAELGGELGIRVEHLPAEIPVAA